MPATNFSRFQILRFLQLHSPEDRENISARTLNLIFITNTLQISHSILQKHDLLIRNKYFHIKNSTRFTPAANIKDYICLHSGSYAQNYIERSLEGLPVQLMIAR